MPSQMEGQVGSVPPLLMQAALSAAQADGLTPPKLSEGDNVDAVAALTSIGGGLLKKQKTSHEPVQQYQQQHHQSVVSGGNSLTAGNAALERARRAIAVSQASAGSAAHMLANSSPAPTPTQTISAPPPSKPAPAQTQPSSSAGKKKGPPLRRGKWTVEEEAYANRLIMEFKAGLLPLTDGTTLRTFLSKLLNCDPMRISKKFVGSNCIGKQVFRRRTADINRLTPEQIQQSRSELSELERRFLERVAQTNRVKSSGVGGGGNVGIPPAGKAKEESNDLGGMVSPPSPPWLRAPNGYKHGNGAAMAAAALSGGASNNRAAAVGRALLGGNNGNSNSNEKLSKSNLQSSGSAGLLALAEMQRRQSSNSQNLLAAAMAGGGGDGNNNGMNGLSGQAMAQFARNASAARIAGLAGNSMNSLVLKAGLSRDQLSQLSQQHQLAASNTSLSGMMDRQSSFDALMSLDFQSLQSIDNLANLIQSGGAIPGHNSVPRSGMKNWDGTTSSSTTQGATTGSEAPANNFSSMANARRIASAGRMENLIRSLSSGNVGNRNNNESSGGGSNANFNNLLLNMQQQGNLGNSGNSANNLFGSGASAMSLANLLRVDSSTGLTALRMQDGLVQRNSSVDDFLSLVASGDIPHQDPYMLNVPLSMQQQQQVAQAAAAAGGNPTAAATYLAQQQLLAQAGALRAQAGSMGNMANSQSSAASLLSQFALQQQQQQQHHQQHHQQQGKSSNHHLLSHQSSNGSSGRSSGSQQNNNETSSSSNNSHELKRKFGEENGGR